jgi:hypothetical protein
VQADERDVQRQPLSPYSAAASGMPIWTALPNEAVMARTLGAAGASQRRRGRSAAVA